MIVKWAEMTGTRHNAWARGVETEDAGILRSAQLFRACDLECIAGANPCGAGHEADGVKLIQVDVEVELDLFSHVDAQDLAHDDHPGAGFGSGEDDLEEF